MEKADFNRKLGLLIKKKRLERNWSQSELASRLKNNFQNISRLERGEVSPTLFWCNQLAEAFDMELHEFVKEFSKSSKK